MLSQGPEGAAPGYGAGWTIETANDVQYDARSYDVAYRELGISKSNDQRIVVNQYERFANCYHSDLVSYLSDISLMLNLEFALLESRDDCVNMLIEGYSRKKPEALT